MASSRVRRAGSPSNAASTSLATRRRTAGRRATNFRVASEAATAQWAQDSKSCFSAKATARRISSSSTTRMRSRVAPMWKESVSPRRSWVPKYPGKKSDRTSSTMVMTRSRDGSTIR